MNKEENKPSDVNVITEYNINKIGFIGTGNLAQILIKGFLSTGLVKPTHIIASDINKDVLESINQTLCIETTTNNADVIQQSNVIIVAVEPQIVPTVLQEVTKYITEDHLLISVAAGLTINTFTKHAIGSNTSLHPRVIRVMPNTPTAVQCGASVFSMGQYTSARDAELVQLLFSSVGLCEILQESYLDAVTGVSGSGPAYMYVAIEALSDGGVKMGLPRDLATKLAAQTMMGAAKMVLETGQNPGQLKDAVTSPGGTTIAGLHELERSGFRASLMNAVETTALKSKELGSHY